MDILTIKKLNPLPLTPLSRICVCIATYRRQRLLERLLVELLKQTTDGLFQYCIVVVDNDATPSALPIVEKIRERAAVNIAYFHEKRRSISYARNLAVEKANGDYVAFIDDDEFPGDRWLIKLFNALWQLNVDGVLGPVFPHFEVSPPRWLLKSKLCERSRLSTGELVQSDRDMRTSNVLLRKEVLQKEDGPFDPRFGKSGGGDAHYFRRMVERGKVFAWCNEACVYETVTLDRYKRGYYVRRALTVGLTQSWIEPAFSFGTAKSLLAVPLYAAALPVLALMPHYLFMRYLVKECAHLGKLLGHLGLSIVKERPY